MASGCRARSARSRLGLDELGIERVGEPRYHFVLHVEQIGDRLVEPFGPEMLAGFGVDQLHIDAKPAAVPLHRALEHIADIQLATDLPYIGRPALVGERGIAADHERAADARQVGGQAFDHAVDEIFLLVIAANVGERQHHDRQPGRRNLHRRCACAQRRRARSVRDHRIGADRTGDILQALLAEVGKFRADLAIHLIVGRRRQTDAAGFSDALEPRRNIDAIAEDVVHANDDVADVDADAKQNPLVSRIADREPVDAALELHGGPHRIDRAGEFGEEAVPGILDDAAAVLDDHRQHRVYQQRSHARMGRFLVRMHQPRIAGDIGHQDRGKPSLDAVAGDEALGI